MPTKININFILKINDAEALHRCIKWCDIPNNRFSLLYVHSFAVDSCLKKKTFIILSNFSQSYCRKADKTPTHLIYFYTLSFLSLFMSCIKRYKWKNRTEKKLSTVCLCVLCLHYSHAHVRHHLTFNAYYTYSYWRYIYIWEMQWDALQTYTIHNINKMKKKSCMKTWIFSAVTDLVQGFFYYYQCNCI